MFVLPFPFKVWLTNLYICCWSSYFSKMSTYDDFRFLRSIFLQTSKCKYPHRVVMLTSVPVNKLLYFSPGRMAPTVCNVNGFHVLFIVKMFCNCTVHMYFVWRRKKWHIMSALTTRELRWLLLALGPETWKRRFLPNNF